MIRIGIICPSEIAYRRFMPALEKCSEFKYIGVAYPKVSEWNGASVANINIEMEKANHFRNEYGGKIFEGYQSLLESDEIDAVYLPLPPALHYYWAKKALNYNKHVFLEKPSTTSYKDTEELVALAKENNLALHENYMFIYHNQIDEIQRLIEQKTIGEIRLIRANFGFPKRAENDFRYNKKLGGGALLDCGGYPIKLMSLLLGNEMKIDSSRLIYNKNEIDLFGSVQLSNENIIAQISFGMDNAYKCDLEIWGSEGTISINRIFTAPVGFEADIYINTNNSEKIIHVEADDTFMKSILKFKQCIIDKNTRDIKYKELLKQIKLIEDVRGKK